MPINACTINTHTINALACRRLQMPPAPISTAGGSVQHVRRQNWHSTRPIEREEHDFETSLESSEVHVEVMFNGKVIGSKNFSKSFTDSIPLVAVSNLQVSEKEAIVVKVTHLTIT